MTETIEVPKGEWEDVQSRLEDVEEKQEQQSDIIDIQSDDGNPVLGDIWVAGIPVGKIIQNARKKSDDAHSRIDDTEETHNQDPDPGCEPDKDNSRTPMEQITALPYDMARNQLKKVHQRAKHVMMEADTWGDRTRKGIVLDSGTIRKILTSSELVDGRAHTQTVSRVMDEMEKLGKKKVSLVMKRGKRRVALDDEMVQWISNGCCDGDQPTTPGESVMVVG